jgi:hypothetical protein
MAAFCSQTDLFLPGEIYIGNGNFNIGGSGAGLALFFSTHADEASSCVLGNIEIDGNINIQAMEDCEVFSSVTKTSYLSKLTLGDVHINGTM